VSGQVLWQARDLILSKDEDIRGFEGQSVSGVECTANGISYSLLTNYGWKMQLAYLTWESEEREVRAVNCDSIEHRMHDICNRVRMSVYEHAEDHDKAWIELSQARMTRGGGSDRATRKRATAIQLLEGAGGIQANRELRSLGADFGTRGQILGDPGLRRGYLCTSFATNNSVVPAVAFVLTRVLPVWNRYAK